MTLESEKLLNASSGILFALRLTSNEVYILKKVGSRERSRRKVPVNDFNEKKSLQQSGGLIFFSLLSFYSRKGGGGTQVIFSVP